MVPVAPVPHVKFTELALAAPLMVPPETLQLYVLPTALVTEYVLVLPTQILLGPAITGTGGGIKVTLMVTVESQPNVLV